MAGRFIGADPIGYTGGMNLYAYVNNNPLNYTDPKGFIKQHVDCDELLQHINEIKRQIAEERKKECPDKNLIDDLEQILKILIASYIENRTEFGGHGPQPNPYPLPIPPPRPNPRPIYSMLLFSLDLETLQGCIECKN